MQEAHFKYFPIFEEMTAQTHLLIAGCTGSGKSTLIKGILNALLIKPPSELGLILIDPKRTELDPYKRLPHVVKYADTNADAISALRYASTLMGKRFDEMKQQGLQETTRPHVYIIIDELADLILNAKCDVLPLLQSIAQLGRAARIHLIAATQSPSRKTLPAEIMVNITAQVALRCRSAIESRQIVGVAGAEELPKYGEIIFYTPDRMEATIIVMPPYEEYTSYLKEQVSFWLGMG